MNGQLPLDLPHRPAYGEEDFLVAPSNERALAMVRLWPDWPHRTLLLTGPRGAGKSHLAAIWARRAGAEPVFARDLGPDSPPILARETALVVEEADFGPLREKEMFHLLNLIGERGAFLLMTARAAPDFWGVATPDLLSRLRRAPRIAIEAPDEDFLRAILVKLFHDRQLLVDASVIDFLGFRLERSFEAAQNIVAALDREALARGRAVTRPLAAAVLKARPDLAAGGEYEEE